MRSASRLYDRLVDLLAAFSAVMLLLLTFIVCADVISRYFRLFTIPWALEVTEYQLFLVTFLGAPWVLKEGAHVSIDIFLAALPRGPRRIADLIGEICGLAVCLVLLFYGVRAMLQSYASGSMIYKEIIIPEWWVQSVIPLCLLLLAIEFVRRIYRIVWLREVKEIDFASAPGI